MAKTGYSRRILTRTIPSLESKGLISVSNRKGQILETSKSRQGSWLYLSFRHVYFSALTSALLGREHVHWSAHKKANKTKLTSTKLSERFNTVKSIGEVINSMPIAKYYEKSN